MSTVNKEIVKDENKEIVKEEESSATSNEQPNESKDQVLKGTPKAATKEQTVITSEEVARVYKLQSLSELASVVGVFLTADKLEQKGEADATSYHPDLEELFLPVKRRTEGVSRMMKATVDLDLNARDLRFLLGRCEEVVEALKPEGALREQAMRLCRAHSANHQDAEKPQDFENGLNVLYVWSWRAREEIRSSLGYFLSLKQRKSYCFFDCICAYMHCFRFCSCCCYDHNDHAYYAMKSIENTEKRVLKLNQLGIDLQLFSK